MLAASQSLLENRSATVTTMGVSLEQDSFAVPSQELHSVYFVVSVTGRSARNDSTSSDEPLLEQSGVDSSSSSSSSSSPVSFQESKSPSVDVTEQGEDSISTIETLNFPTDLQTPCVRAKYGPTIIGLTASPTHTVTDSETDKPKLKKKKKWRSVCAEDMGFKLTLFPRVPVPSEEPHLQDMDPCDSAVMESEPLQYVTVKAQPFTHLMRFEGSGLTREEKMLRRDRDHRVKSRKQLKSKSITCSPRLDVRVRHTLYIHFRLYKRRLVNLQCAYLEHPNLPSSPSRPGVCMDVARSAVKAQARCAGDGGPLASGNRRGGRGPPAQNLAHALDDNNAASELPTDIISFLISIQHREMTPEDYEMLLRLDEGVAPKTVDQGVISAFKTDVVDESTAGEGVCSVCMEGYEVGQERKFLPCDHVFHVQCIDMWLANSSQNCPLDGLPVGFS